MTQESKPRTVIFQFNNFYVEITGKELPEISRITRCSEGILESMFVLAYHHDHMSRKRLRDLVEDCIYDDISNLKRCVFKPDGSYFFKDI